MSLDIALIQKEVDAQVGDPKIAQTLVSTVFKGLQPASMKTALLEGRLRGFEFKDFLEKNIYAVPFRGGYSLVNSIGYVRKIGMRSGVVGKMPPKFTEDNGKIITCEVVIKRMISGYVGEFSAVVYFDEYYTGNKNADGTIKLDSYGKEKAPGTWDLMPHTMIAKVAEMHALRMACPEELSQVYIEEEFTKQSKEEEKPLDTTNERKLLESADSIEKLSATWNSIAPKVKLELESLKNELKQKLSQTEEPKVHEGEITLTDIEKL